MAAEGEAYCLARMNITLVDAGRISDERIRPCRRSIGSTSAGAARDPNSGSLRMSVHAGMPGSARECGRLLFVASRQVSQAHRRGTSTIRFGAASSASRAGRAFALAAMTKLVRRTSDSNAASDAYSSRDCARCREQNDEGVALEAFDQHPEMILRRADFGGWRINWNDKAANIVELAQELNLGLDSSCHRRQRRGARPVQEALPEVLCRLGPRTRTRFGEAIRELDCFDKAAVTAEDRERPRMYAQDGERRRSLALVHVARGMAADLDD